MTQPLYKTHPGIFVLLAVLALPGCSQLASSASSDNTQTAGADAPINWADVENFNEERYAEEQPSPGVEITHDVPPELLRNGGMTGESTGEQPGFRINILSTVDPVEADRMAANATEWWQTQRDEGELEEIYAVREWEPPIYQDYRAPYYRVRMGNFAAREDAQRMLDYVESTYPNAFIVPDQVVIR